MIQERPGTASRFCPACNSKVALDGGVCNGFDLCSCCKCGTLYVVHLPEEGDEQDYDNYGNYDNPTNLKTPDFVGKRLDEIMASFAPHRQNNRLLDVGFGAGDLLLSAVRAGWNATGIEVSKTAVEYARSLGIDVFHGTLAEAGYADDSFDVVTASEVLEHIPDPQEVIREVARVLRPGGLFWATTPHGRGISARLLGINWSVVSPPEHLQLFSARGMKILLQNQGFRQINIATHGTNPTEIFHSLRRRNDARTSADTIENFNRVESSYRLNESLLKSPSRRVLKSLLNKGLNVSRLGDSLKMRAVL